MNRLLTPSDAAACFAMAGILAACATAPSPEACSPAKLVELEAEYIVEVLDACDGQHLDKCEAFPPIRERYDDLRQEWVRCK